MYAQPAAQTRSTNLGREQVPSVMTNFRILKPVKPKVVEIQLPQSSLYERGMVQCIQSLPFQATWRIWYNGMCQIFPFHIKTDIKLLTNCQALVATVGASFRIYLQI